MKWRILVLVSAIVIGGILRITKLETRPTGFTWDEAALGYNAYSLFQTGKDEYGQILPVIFKSFGDYKPGAYIYLTVPAIALGGLNEFTTRLPSALIGILLIVAITVLAGILLGKAYVWVALLAAINPWLIHFSRGAWEANMALFLVVLGSILLIRKRYLISAIFFGITLWTYQGAKLFTPLLIGLLAIIYQRQIFRDKKWWGFGLFILFLIPILLGWNQQSGRLKVFSVFSYTRQMSDIEEIVRQDNNLSSIFPLFHSESYDQLRGVVLRYTNYFSPYFVFFAGDWTNLRHTTPYYGYLHIPEILTVIIGLVVLLKRPGRHSSLIFGWLLLAPIAAALSRDNVSGVRGLPMAIGWIMISGAGLHWIFKNKLIWSVFMVCLAFFTSFYLDLYYLHSPHMASKDWLYPYEKSIQSVAQNYDLYDHIIFSDSLGQPYIFNLFYLKYDPAKYQAQSKLTENSEGDVGNVEGFDKFEFRHIYWPEDRKLVSTLFVGDMNELPALDLESTPNLIEIADVNYPNGSPGFKVVGLP
jgi:4-amino-4-deoxy-L-arabinose transferase-like glycosyltransferase